VEERFRAELAEARRAGADFESQRAIWERNYTRGGFANIYFRHYRTADGFVSVGCLSPQLNARFRQVTGVYDPRTEAGFVLGSAEGMERLQRLVSEAEALFASKTSAEWLSLLRAGKVPCGPFNFPPDVFTDPQLLENDYVVEVEHPLFGTYKTFGPVVKMDATPTRITAPPPLLDEHTDEVLAELGFAATEIDGLRAAGVAGRS
jgi:formyl-CoA transferase/CoA:oxalate CoA-transferase